MLNGVLTAVYCVFETCKVLTLLKLYFERYSFKNITFYQISQPFPEKDDAKQELFSGENVIPLLCLYSEQKSRKTTF